MLCPPYDLITPQMQESLRRRNPYNVVHLEAGEGLDWTDPASDKYRRTAALFNDWTSKGVLKRDGEPSIYLSRQEFNHQGQRWARLGLTACVGLEEYGEGQVLPHEYTEAPAIRDRVSLMEACGANFSAIMSLYQDAEGQLAALIRQVTAEVPELDVQDDSGNRSTLWRWQDAASLEQVSRFFRERPVFLADGHHRYEAALGFQRNRGDQGSTGSEQAAHNFVMMTLIAFEDPGLLVLPYHRILRGLSAEKLSQVRALLSQIFQSKSFAATGKQAGEELVAQVSVKGREREGKERHALGLVEPEGWGLLSLRSEVNWEKWGPLAVSEAWILEEQVLRPVLGDATLDHLGYIHDHQEAISQVADGQIQMAFLLKPFPMGQFQQIVSQGQRLPRKSTFFYPKLPTGLVINQLSGNL